MLRVRLLGAVAVERDGEPVPVAGSDFVWQLLEDGPGTRIDVHVTLPDSEAHRLEGEREIITTSLAQLATLAEADGNS